MAAEEKRTLAKVVIGALLTECEYHIIGRLEGIPQIGYELTYLSDGERCNTQEIVRSIITKDRYHSFYPGRMTIITDKNIYIADNFITFNENSRRGSRLRI